VELDINRPSYFKNGARLPTDVGCVIGDEEAVEGAHASGRWAASVIEVRTADIQSAYRRGAGRNSTTSTTMPTRHSAHEVSR